MSSLSAKVQQTLKLKTGKNIIVTVGNSLRADDGIGPYIGSKIKSGNNLFVFDSGSNPENAISEIAEINPVKIIIIDAANFGARLGRAELIDIKDIPEATISTHTIPLSVVAKILEQDTKAEIKFIGVQVGCVRLGENLTKEVKETADEIINQIKEKMYA